MLLLLFDVDEPFFYPFIKHVGTVENVSLVREAFARPAPNGSAVDAAVVRERFENAVCNLGTELLGQ